MFIALVQGILPLRQERNVVEMSQTHGAPLERTATIMEDYKHRAPLEHFHA